MTEEQRMTAGNLREYLGTFPENAEVHFAAVDTESRLKYEIREAIVITDADEPFIIINVGSSGNLERAEAS